MAHPRYGKSFGMRVGGWWGQWRLDSRDVQWSLIGCLMLRPNFFCLVLVHKKVWCSLSSLSIQTGVLIVTFRITLMTKVTSRSYGYFYKIRIFLKYRNSFFKLCINQQFFWQKHQGILGINTMVRRPNIAQSPLF